MTKVLLLKWDLAKGCYAALVEVGLANGQSVEQVKSISVDGEVGFPRCLLFGFFPSEFQDSNSSLCLLGTESPRLYCGLVRLHRSVLNFWSSLSIYLGFAFAHGIMLTMGIFQITLAKRIQQSPSEGRGWTVKAHQGRLCMFRREDRKYL